MLRSVHKYLLQFFVAFCLAACAGVSEIGNPSEGDSNFISFNVSETMTKVSDDDIKDHLLCIYIFDDGKPLGNRIWSNYRLKYDNESKCWRFWNGESYEDIEWGTGTHEFFAYNEVNYYWLSWTNPNYLIDFTFKYNGAHSTLSASSSINMLYPTDGIASKGYSQDFIYAYVSRDVESEDGFGPVSLEFGHAFSSVQITVKNNSWVTKNIEDLKLSQIRCNTGTGAAPSIDFSGTVSFNPGDLGDYPSSGKSLDHGDVWEVFDNPMVVLPQSVDHAVHNIQWTENGNYKYINIRDLETTSWDSGKLYHYVITLDPTELILEPTATIDTEDAGGNKFSVVNVNLNATDGELQRITSLLITVTDPESNVIKTYEAATVVSNEISMECDKLLNPGTYTVSVAYDDGLKRQSVSTTAVLKDTAVQPAVGYYVNSDGTFSETFVSGESIAKIFWIGSLSSDTQLVSDYSYLAAEGTDHGLAYIVDPDAGAMVCEAYYDTWSSGSTSIVNWDNQYDYTSEQNIHGYSNTYAIKACADKGYMTQIDLNTAVVPGKTSPWYIPSIGELKSMTDIPSTNDDLWTSTIYSFTNLTKTIDSAFYKCSTQQKIQQTNGSYYKYYIRILAF